MAATDTVFSWKTKEEYSINNALELLTTIKLPYDQTLQKLWGFHRTEEGFWADFADIDHEF